MLEFLVEDATAYKETKGLSTDQLKDYVEKALIYACEDEDDLIILFVID